MEVEEADADAEADEDEDDVRVDGHEDGVGDRGDGGGRGTNHEHGEDPVEQESGRRTLFRQRSLAGGEAGREETGVRGLLCLCGWLAVRCEEAGFGGWAHRGAAGEEKRERQDPLFGDFLLDFWWKGTNKGSVSLAGPQPDISTCAAVPLDAVKVMTTMLPNTEKAMRPDMTRGANSAPKTSSKKTVAMSILP